MHKTVEALPLLDAIKSFPLTHKKLKKYLTNVYVLFILLLLW